MAMRGRPKAPGMVQICFRVPSDIADFIREMSIKNDRQPGAELARMIRPVIEAEMKRRAWEEQQQQRSPPPQAAAHQPQRRNQKKVEPQPGSIPTGTEPDLFGTVEVGKA